MDRTEPFYIELHPNITSGSDYYYDIGIYAYCPSSTVRNFDTFEYSLDKINWVNVEVVGLRGDKSIVRLDNPVDGTKVWLRAKPSNGSWGISSSNYVRLSISGLAGNQRVNLGGNIMSLVYGRDFTGDEVSFPDNTSYNFYELFEGCRPWIVDASQLLLPATTLTNRCYGLMFNGCTALTAAPELPAMTLANHCYYSMFDGCTSLITAPELPATTLPYGCYVDMFYGCKALTTAPIIIQATIQDGHSYDNMFRGCTSLESLTIENTNIRVYDTILYHMSPKTIVYKKEGVTTPLNPNHLTVVTLKNTPFNVANVKKWVINNKEVKQVVDSQGRIIWKKKPIDYTEPFYVEDMSGSENTLSIRKSGSSAPALTIEKSTDGTNWSTLGTTSESDISTTVPANGKVYLRCNATTWAVSASGHNTIRCSGDYKVGGNIMSLLYGSNFTGNEISFPSDSSNNFLGLFRTNWIYISNKIKDASKLILPATTLTNQCYDYMFSHCSKLIAPPELPATTLAYGCYWSMFDQCTSLTTAPVLQALSIPQSGYRDMFNGCTALTTAPVLPATTLSDYCYMGMFYGCTSLTTSPELLASTPEDQSYSDMFYGCTSLNNVKCLAIDLSATAVTRAWLYNVSATGTFTKKAGVTWPSGDDGIPSGWTVVEV